MNYIELPELPEPVGGMINSIIVDGLIVPEIIDDIACGTNLYSDVQMRHYALLVCGDLQRQLTALTEDYKDLEAQLMAVGAGGVSKLMGDKE